MRSGLGGAEIGVGEKNETKNTKNRTEQTKWSMK